MMTAVITRYNRLNSFNGWLAYSICSAFVALQFILQGSVGLMVPELRQSLNMSLNQIGWLSAAFFYPYVLMQVPSGMLACVFGVRKLIIIASLLMALSCVMFSMVTEFESAMLARLLMGAASAPGIVCLMEIISTRFSLRTVGFLVGAMEVSGMIGAATGDFFIPPGIQAVGWRGVMLIFASVALLFIPLAYFILHPVADTAGSSHAHKCDSEQYEEIENTDQNIRDESNQTIWRQVLRDSQLWLLGIYSGLAFTVLNVFAALWAVPFLSIAASDCAKECAARLVGLIFVGAGCGGMTLSLIFSRWKISYKLMISGSAITPIVLWFVVYRPEWISGIQPFLMLLLGFCTGIYLIPFMLIKERFSGKKRAVAVGLTNMLSVMVGALILQPVIGFMLQNNAGTDLLKIYQQSFNLLLTGLIISFVIAVYCHRSAYRKKVDRHDTPDYEIFTCRDIPSEAREKSNCIKSIPKDRVHST